MFMRRLLFAILSAGIFIPFPVKANPYQMGMNGVRWSEVEWMQQNLGI